MRSFDNVDPAEKTAESQNRHPSSLHAFVHITVSNIHREPFHTKLFPVTLNKHLKHWMMSDAGGHGGGGGGGGSGTGGVGAAGESTLPGAIVETEVVELQQGETDAENGLANVPKVQQHTHSLILILALHMHQHAPRAKGGEREHHLPVNGALGC